MKSVVVLGFMLSVAQAATWLENLQQHPSLQAARSQYLSAKLQKQTVDTPVSLNTQAGYGWQDYSALTADGSQMSLTATLRPFAYGDIADMLAKTDIGIKQAELGYLSAVTNLQAQALSAAYQLKLAEQALALAEDAQKLAESSLNATVLQNEKGLLPIADVRSAKTSYADSAERLRSAKENVELARDSLKLLVGNADVPEITLNPPQNGNSSEVKNAKLSVDLAEISANASLRGLLPTLSVSYNNSYNSYNSYGVSLESRTLQPKVSWSYQTTSRATTVPKQTFQIGLVFDITPTIQSGIAVAEKQKEIARLSADAAQQNQELQQQSLNLRYEQAKRTEILKKQSHQDSLQAVQEAQKRESLGLASPLATLKAILDESQALLAWQQAQNDVLSRALDIYRFYAEPPFKVAL